MTDCSPAIPLNPDNLLDTVEQVFESTPPNTDQARETFRRIAQVAVDVADPDLAALCALLSDLSSLATSWLADAHDDGEGPAAEVLDLCRSSLPVIRAALDQQPGALDQVRELQQSAQSHWEEYLELLAPDERCLAVINQQRLDSEADDFLGDEFDIHDAAESALAGIDIGMILSRMAGATDDFSSEPNTKPSPKPELTEEVDPELMECFFEDARHSLSVMEQCLLKVESSPEDAEPLRQFCRELHTLKGASGTVGLSKLSKFLHDLEDRVEAMAAKRTTVDVDALLAGIDAVRSQMGSGESSSPNSQSVTASKQESFTAHADVSDGGGALRLEPARLERLMDMLTELVMLRNRRETYHARFVDLHHELSRCGGRLRVLQSASSGRMGRLVAPQGGQRDLALDPDSHWHSRSLVEMANDLASLGRTLQEAYEPLERDNMAVSHLIGRFRQELMELRRLPIAGLFRRLQRAARDAARVEGKQVDVEFHGEGIRTERALQEQLFEPLMHLVRNAVSHGIGSPADRQAQGKPASGRIVIEADSTASLLNITIRDDGRGLDEAAFQRRGREMGLLPPGQPVASETLWKLIFHPGLSTRSNVNAIAGRGIGMDVVAARIHQMRGRLDVESVPNQGTTFRMQIPLRSAIEHAMLIRVNGQLFALPMQSVYGIGDGQASNQAQRQNGEQRSDGLEEHPVPLRELLGLEGQAAAHPQVLTLTDNASRRRLSSESTHSTAGGNKTGARQLQILVDAVVGVEEVVVRSLPSMLHGHELFSGVTLSGDAETVLIFDVPRLIDCGLSQDRRNLDMEQRLVRRESIAKRISATGAQRNANGAILRCLVVDDSLTARRQLVRKLARLGVETEEAPDGVAALDLLRNGEFHGVVTDLDMPRMNGVDLFDEIRRRSPHKNLPVAIFTSRTASDTVQIVPEARLIFVKPATDEAVAEIVAEFSKAQQA